MARTLLPVVAVGCLLDNPEFDDSHASSTTGSTSEATGLTSSSSSFTSSSSAPTTQGGASESSTLTSTAASTSTGAGTSVGVSSDASSDTTGAGTTAADETGTTGAPALQGCGDGGAPFPGDFCFNHMAVPITGVHPHPIVLADINDDGHLDVAAGHGGPGAAVIEGDGAGGFAVAGTFGVGNLSVSIASADFDGDGTPDLVLGYENHTMELLRNDGGGAYMVEGVSLNEAFRDVAVGDLGGDAAPDIAVLLDVSDEVQVFYNAGGDFDFDVVDAVIPVGAGPTALAVGDLNGDGLLDLISTNATDHTVTVALRQGGGFGAPVDVMVGDDTSLPSDVVVGEFTGDAETDVVVANQGSGQLALLQGVGGGAIELLAHHDVSVAPWRLVSGDFDVDGALDVAVIGFELPPLVFLGGDGQGGFNELTTVTTGGGLRWVAVADINADGVDDVLTANHDIEALGVSLSDP